MNVENLIIFTQVITAFFFFLYFMLFRRIQKGGRKYIIAGMLLALYLSVYEFIFTSGFYETSTWMFVLYFPAIMAFYPLIYHFLVFTLKDKNERVIVKIFSLLPFITFVIIAVLYLPLDYHSKLEFIQNDFNLFDYSLSVFSIFQATVYILYYIQLLIFIFIFFQMYYTQKKNKKLNDYEKLFLPGWLFFCITVIILYEFLYLLAIVLNLNGYETVIQNIANLSMLLFLGFLGIYHDDMQIKMILNREEYRKNHSNDKTKSVSQEDASEIMDSIYDTITKYRLFENPGLKLEHLAKKRHLPEKKLSSVINQQTGNNFSYFLNSIRVEKAKELMTAENKGIKIEDIYLRVGYYTRSTFNRAFKTIEGITPTDYIRTKM